MIDQITKKIAIGEYSDAMNEEALKHYGFDCILNINEVELEHDIDYEKLGIQYRWQPIPRNREKNTEQSFKDDIRLASVILTYLTKYYDRILVHCCAGIDRAPLVVARHIADRAYLTIPQAYDVVEKQRPQLMRHMEWV